MLHKTWKTYSIWGVLKFNMVLQLIRSNSPYTNPKQNKNE